MEDSRNINKLLHNFKNDNNNEMGELKRKYASVHK